MTEPFVLFVKVCGIVVESDAEACVLAGVSALGVNLVVGSKRCVSVERARAISRVVRGHATVFGVVAGGDLDELRRLRVEAELDVLQLHGDESPATVQALLPAVVKAVRIGDEADVAAADRYEGALLLLDAKVQGALGGTGKTFPWSLAEPLARRRRVIVAGGLTPDNVAEAVRRVRPYGVDTASGVERRAGAPGEKDAELVRRFVAEARGA